ncbi:MAG: hydrogen peroxide-inducible genes activator [Chromatiales bacterium]|nr:hydrogen peroxide-inducible genes activator [Chromatiales bacterium]
MNLPTPKQLLYFTAVAELQHFGRAAERCFVTHSTLSAGIQELEYLLDTVLFERSKRQVILTAKGAELLVQAQRILAMSKEFVETAKSDGTPLSGSLRMGVIPTIGPFLLPRVLPVIRQRYPSLELLLVEDRTASLVDKLNRGELEAAIIAFPYDVGQLEQELFWQEDFVLVLPRQHRLAREQSLATASLPGNELLLLEEGHCLTDHALGVCHLQQLKGKTAFQGTSLYTLLEMVAGGLGMTFVPQMALGEDLNSSKEIALVPLAEPGPHRQIGIIWRRTYYRKTDLRLLAKEMRALLQKEV